MSNFLDGSASAAIFPRYWPDQYAGSKTGRRDRGEMVAPLICAFSNHFSPRKYLGACKTWDTWDNMVNIMDPIRREQDRSETDRGREARPKVFLL